MSVTFSCYWLRKNDYHLIHRNACVSSVLCISFKALKVIIYKLYLRHFFAGKYHCWFALFQFFLISWFLDWAAHRVRCYCHSYSHLPKLSAFCSLNSISCISQDHTFTRELFVRYHFIYINSFQVFAILVFFFNITWYFAYQYFSVIKWILIPSSTKFCQLQSELISVGALVAK